MNSLNVIMCILIPFLVIGSGILAKMSIKVGINKVFGYRTKSSKMNQETWKEANTIASKYLKIFGFFDLALTILIVIFFIDNTETALIVVCVMVVPILLFPIYLTEKHMKNTFNNKGKRIKH